MGQIKQYELECYSRGYDDPPEKCVCADHFDDNFVVDFIKKNAEAGTCDYCGMRRKVIELLPLVGFMNDKIKRYWGDINDQALYLASSFEIDDDSPHGHGFYRAGSFAMPKGRHTYSFADLIWETDLSIDNDTLLDDITDCFGVTDFCLNDPVVSTKSEELSGKWAKFTHQVKHSRRFTFNTMVDEKAEELGDSENGLEDILTEIGKYIRNARLVKELDADTSLFRCQLHKESDKIDNTIERIGSPPDDIAKQNRMSPAGISMFYGGLNEETAKYEVLGGDKLGDGMAITVGEFKLKGVTRIVDFTALPNRLSHYADYNYYDMLFLKEFVGDMAKPIVHDDRIHIEYIPTQIVTEYIKHIFRDKGGNHVDGFIYNSSQHKGGKCCVLFYDQRVCKEKLDMPNHYRL